ncbi:MAG TPA: hypothetical protein VHD91_05955 [Gaiellaceae bacterium]|nr:hypothetical protein [Gaiellaceae bacterium]
MRIRLPKAQSRAPFAIAAFIAIPLFFSALMASALALEKPLVHQWKGCKHGLCTTWRDPTTATEARIWLWALVPPLVLVLVGLVAMRIPLGFYASCAAACVIAMAVVHDTATWAAHHTSRYPWGVDLIPGTNAASNQWDPSEWESEARETALSLQHWTIGVALAAAAVMLFLWVRGRYFGRRPAIDAAPPEGMHAPDATTPSL